MSIVNSKDLHLGAGPSLKAYEAPLLVSHIITRHRLRTSTKPIERRSETAGLGLILSLSVFSSPKVLCVV
jgi:hypothetical protein